jgi:DNA-binding response OmpR family regulator
MRLLIIEDNVQLVESLREQLSEYFQIDASTTGKDGLRKATSDTYDIIVLDLGLPDKDGLEICALLRQENVHAPILILTATDEPGKKVQLLDGGADDYVTKPFHVNELRARLQALVRRTVPLRASIVTLEHLTLDLSRRTVTHAGQQIPMRRKEFDILEYLVQNRGRVLSRAMISNHVSEIGKDTWSNVVDVYIKRLRDKLERPFGKQIIETVHRMGYTIK